MSCNSVQELISSLLDRKVSGGERENVLAHLESCRKCSARWEEMHSLRAALREMDRPPMPDYLQERLRVLASHERERRLTRVSLSARLQYWSSQIQLAFDNLMRPMALPFAGGLLSALLLFGILVPTLSFRHDYGNEPPTSVFTDPDGRVVGAFGDIPRLESVDAVISEDETVVELTIDAQGRVADYSVNRGELTPDMESIILFSRFTPATIFGQPTWGKKLVSFRRSHSVRG